MHQFLRRHEKKVPSPSKERDRVRAYSGHSRRRQFLDFSGEPGNLAGCLVAMDSSLGCSLVEEGGSRAELFCGLFSVFGVDSRKNLLDLRLDGGCDIPVSQPLPLVLTRPLQG